MSLTGSELNNTSGWYETLFRGYDAALGRFLQIDPLAAKGHSGTAYNYAANNPIYKKYNLFDQNHRSPYIDLVNFRIGMDFTIKKKKGKSAK